MNTERMRENLELTHGALFSQAVLNALVESGMSRDDAYRIVQRDAQRAWDERRPFRELLEQEPEVTGRLDAATCSTSCSTTHASCGTRPR